MSDQENKPLPTMEELDALEATYVNKRKELADGIIALLEKHGFNCKPGHALMTPKRHSCTFTAWPNETNLQ